LIVNDADLTLAPTPALIVTDVVVETPSDVTENEADVRPAGTVIDNGAATCGLLELMDTIAPQSGAGFSSVTDPLQLRPPWMDPGLTITLRTDTGSVPLGFCATITAAMPRRE